jgi:hypothetical protein
MIHRSSTAAMAAAMAAAMYEFFLYSKSGKSYND